jgi:hypothetical protein
MRAARSAQRGAHSGWRRVAVIGDGATLLLACLLADNTQKDSALCAAAAGRLPAPPRMTARAHANEDIPMHFPHRMLLCCAMARFRAVHALSPG